MNDSCKQNENLRQKFTAPMMELRQSNRPVIPVAALGSVPQTADELLF